MKKFLTLILLLFAFNGMSQKPTQFGLNISPGIRLITSKIKNSGLPATFQRGYGFDTGIPVKFWLNDFTSLNTGLDFEYSAFDLVENQVLVSSFRITSLHLPLMFNLHLSGNFYAMLGTGASYNLSVRDLNKLGGSELKTSANPIQPYLGIGLNSLLEKDFGTLEVGFLGRYQLLNIWKKNSTILVGYTQHIISLDLVFRYYF